MAILMLNEVVRDNLLWQPSSRLLIPPNDNDSWFIFWSHSEAQASRASRVAHGQPCMTSEHPDVLSVLSQWRPQCSSLGPSSGVMTKSQALP